MAKCKLDVSTSPSFRKCLKKIRKKNPYADEALGELKTLIEADYLSRKAVASRLIMRDQPTVQGLVYKYDFDACGDTKKKHGRASHRLIAMFLDDTETLYAVSAFPRPNNDFVDAREMVALMNDLRREIANPIEDPDEDEDGG